MYEYPDVVIVCGEPEYVEEQGRSLLNPVALVEVLSPSTEGYDRGVKSQRYGSLRSFQEYAVASQSQAWVEL